MNDYRSHLSVTIWIVLASLTLGLLITIPERALTLSVFGSPIALRFSAPFLAGMLALAATWAGLEAALHTHPQKALVKRTYRFWGAPTAVVLTAAVSLPAMGQGLLLAALALTGILLAASVVGEYRTIAPDAPSYGQARLLLNGLAYAVAALAFILVYLSHSRSLVSATFIGIIAGLLAIDLLRGSLAPMRLVYLYSAFIALALAQLTAVLNYWPHVSVRVALLLLVGFYLLTGISQQALKNQFRRRQLFEYLLIAVVTIAVIFAFPGK